MKKIIGLFTICIAFIFTACEQENISNTLQEEVLQAEGTLTLPTPKENAPSLSALTASVVEEALTVETSAKEVLALPAMVEKKGASEVESRSCIVHYDFPIFYNVNTGRLRIDEKTACFDSDFPYGDFKSLYNIGTNLYQTFAVEDNFSIGDGQGKYIAYGLQDYQGKLYVGRVTSAGVRSTIQTYNWVDYWTHATPLQNGMFLFYSGIYGGRVYIARHTSAGWEEIRQYSSWDTDWSHFVHLGNGKLLTYARSSGKLYVNQIDDSGHWTVLRSTNIGANWEQITALGRQTEVRSGVCCYYIGQGFMTCSRATNRWNIYNVAQTTNNVSLRRTYNTTGWTFDIIAQLQGNKFITHERATNRTLVGYMTETTEWVWNQTYYTDAGNYTQIFTMSFR
jgi:hypothetical protein